MPPKPEPKRPDNDDTIGLILAAMICFVLFTLLGRLIRRPPNRCRSLQMDRPMAWVWGLRWLPRFHACSMPTFGRASPTRVATCKRPLISQNFPHEGFGPGSINSGLNAAIFLVRASSCGRRQPDCRQNRKVTR